MHTFTNIRKCPCPVLVVGPGADLERLATSFGERHVEATLLQGQPEDVIPEFVVADGIDLVVMGTVARRGFPGLLIGNTAERVLRKLPCSVLAVKPEGSCRRYASTRCA